LCKSSASCYLSDITGFVFGAVTSRFWMLRKHLISIGNDDDANVPFYSWECITILTKER